MSAHRAFGRPGSFADGGVRRGRTQRVPATDVRFDAGPPLGAHNAMLLFASGFFFGLSAGTLLGLVLGSLG